MPSEDFQGVTYVWVIEENVRGKVVSFGAYYSRVQYSVNGIDFEVDLLNDEFLVMEDRNPDFVGDEDEE